MRASKVLIAAALSAICVLAFGVTGASANPTHGGACAFTGLAGNITGTNNPPGVEALLTDLLKVPQPNNTPTGTPLDILLDTDSGTYTFGGSATCLINDARPNSPRVEQNVSITSAGAYTNTICGTGTATSRNQTTVKDSLGGMLVDTVDYDILFVGGNGALSITKARDASDGNFGSGAGYVHITPTQGGNCVTTDVSKFDVAGAFAVHES
jgi:hypothetical protein